MAAVKQRKDIDAVLAAVVSNPVRARAFMLLAERTASPMEIARLLGKEVSEVAYHIRKLKSLDLVELVDEQPVRGAVEHFYRAVMRPMVSTDEQAQMSIEERNVFPREVCQLIFADVAAAIHSQTFSSRPDNQFVRFPMLLDAAGYEAASQVYDEALEKLLDIQAESTGRKADNPEIEQIHTEAVHLLFERDMKLSSPR